MRALVLSGGGNKGGYEVGALLHLLGDLKIQYDILCGVSVGAINVAYLAQFPVGQEKEAAITLGSLWRSLSTKKIYKRWFPFGRWHSLWKHSFYDSSPLQELIKNKLSLDKIRASGKKVSVGAVGLHSGKYTIFNQDCDQFVEAVMASCSFPGMFLPVQIGNQLWTDGGLKESSPIKTAIDLGATQIDAIVTFPDKRIPMWIDKPTTADILKRSFDLTLDKIMFNDLEKFKMYNKLAEAGVTDKKVVKLNLIKPQFNLTDEMLDFEQEKIEPMIEKGYKDAIRCLNNC